MKPFHSIVIQGYENNRFLEIFTDEDGQAFEIDYDSRKIISIWDWDFSNHITQLARRLTEIVYISDDLLFELRYQLEEDGTPEEFNQILAKRI